MLRGLFICITVSFKQRLISRNITKRSIYAADRECGLESHYYCIRIAKNSTNRCLIGQLIGKILFIARRLLAGDLSTKNLRLLTFASFYGYMNYIYQNDQEKI